MYVRVKTVKVRKCMYHYTVGICMYLRFYTVKMNCALHTKSVPYDAISGVTGTLF